MHSRFVSAEESDESLRPALERLLLARSAQESKPLYWQGTAYIAAICLLVVEDEATSFAVFLCLMDQLLRSASRGARRLR